MVSAKERAEIRAEMARELLEVTGPDAAGCSFFACPGPDVEPVDMATCRCCWAIHNLKAIAALSDQRATSGEGR